MKKKISVNFFASPGIGKGRVNPFVPNVPFLYTHKISENLTWRIGKECIVNKWVNKNHLQYSSEVNISIFYLLISFRSCFTPLQKIIEIPQVWGVCWGFPHSTKTILFSKLTIKSTWTNPWTHFGVSLVTFNPFLANVPISYFVKHQKIFGVGVAGGVLFLPNYSENTCLNRYCPSSLVNKHYSRDTNINTYCMHQYYSEALSIFI